MNLMHSETNSGFVRKLADLFVGCPIGGQVTYADLTRALGFDVKQRRYFIISALKLANVESGSIFINVKMTGYERVTAEKADTILGRFRGSFRRRARSVIRQVDNAVAKSNDISDGARVRIGREQSILGLMVYMARDRSVHPAKEGSPPPPTAETIRVFIEAQRASRGMES